jgi:hypothetical protein
MHQIKWRASILCFHAWLLLDHSGLWVFWTLWTLKLNIMMLLPKLNSVYFTNASAGSWPASDVGDEFASCSTLIVKWHYYWSFHLIFVSFVHSCWIMNPCGRGRSCLGRPSGWVPLPPAWGLFLRYICTQVRSVCNYKVNPCERRAIGLLGVLSSPAVVSGWQSLSAAAHAAGFWTPCWCMLGYSECCPETVMMLQWSIVRRTISLDDKQFLAHHSLTCDWAPGHACMHARCLLLIWTSFINTDQINS